MKSQSRCAAFCEQKAAKKLRRWGRWEQLGPRFQGVNVFRFSRPADGRAQPGRLYRAAQHGSKETIFLT